MGEVTKGGTLDRREVVSRLLADRKDLLVVTGLGSASYDVMAAGDHDNNYYLWAAMGSAAMVGLGLANAKPTHSVLVDHRRRRDADGLRRAGHDRSAKPAESDDRRSRQRAFRRDGHAGQPRRTRHQPRPGCRSCGFSWTSEISDMAGVDDLRERLSTRDGVKLATIKIQAENLPRVLPPRDGVYIKNRFRAALGHRRSDSGRDETMADLVRFRNFVNGQSRESASGHWLVSTNPYTGAEWAEVPHCGVDDVNDAIEAAHQDVYERTVGDAQWPPPAGNCCCASPT